jgi:hypothetical protein
MTLGKTLAMLLCLGILVSNLLSMSRWTEDRNVNDDACYLRQAHLFQRFGLDGLDTTLARDDDGYMLGKMRNFLAGINPGNPRMRPVTHSSRH